jgi:hypothetical protein
VAFIPRLGLVRRAFSAPRSSLGPVFGLRLRGIRRGLSSTRCVRDEIRPKAYPAEFLYGREASQIMPAYCIIDEGFLSESSEPKIHRASKSQTSLSDSQAR